MWNYRVYGDNYFKGWELINKKPVYTEDAVNHIIDNMDPHTYRSYLVIRHDLVLDMDEVIDRNSLDMPKSLSRKR